MRRIYLDNNASAPIDSRVYKVLIEFLQDEIGNASSIHSFGQKQKAELIDARHTIVEILHVKPNELYFTSGATESVNMVLRGIYSKKKNRHIITTNVEHSSVYETIKKLEERGARVTYLNAGQSDHRVDRVSPLSTARGSIGSCHGTSVRLSG